MTDAPAFRLAAAIEASLALLAERCPDPTPHVYRNLFARHPQMEVHFWRDSTGDIKGEMLSRTFAAILDFIGERRYADHMIGTEMVTHEGYDIPREIFFTFFETVGDTVREQLGGDWTAAHARAWREMLADMASFAAGTPRTDASNAYFKALLTDFEAERPEAVAIPKSRVAIAR